MDATEQTRRLEEPPAPVRRRRAKAPPPARACPNCGTWVDDAFCPRCGQRNAPRLVSVRRFVRDALEDTLALDGKLPRTAGGLLFRPGLLTREYIDGRIARYVPPLRLYLVCSLLFFLAMASYMDADRIWEEVKDVVEAAERQEAAEGNNAMVPNVNLGLDPDTVGGTVVTRPLRRLLIRQQARLNAMTPREALRVQVEAAERTAPKVMFLVVPLLAAMLKLLYVRRKQLYAQHFVFALHFHAFAFVVSAVVLWLRVPILASVLFAALVLYLAMKRVYGQGWGKTAAKYAAVLFYAVAGVLTIAGVAIGSILSA